MMIYSFIVIVVFWFYIYIELTLVDHDPSGSFPSMLPLMVMEPFFLS